MRPAAHRTGDPTHDVPVHCRNDVGSFVLTDSAIRLNLATDSGLSIEHNSNNTIRTQEPPEPRPKSAKKTRTITALSSNRDKLSQFFTCEDSKTRSTQRLLVVAVFAAGRY